MLNSEEQAAIAQILHNLGESEFYLRSQVTQSIPVGVAAQCLNAARLSLVPLLESQPSSSTIQHDPRLGLRDSVAVDRGFGV